MGAIFPIDTKIYISTAGTAGSALASSDAVTTEVTNFSVNGGSKDVEAIPLFGGAFINKELPREQYELALDVIVDYANSVRWDALIMGGTISSVEATSAGVALPKKIFIESVNGTDYRTMAMDNCLGVTFEPEMSADEYLKGTITFKFSATDEDALANLKIKNVAASNVFFN